MKIAAAFVCLLALTVASGCGSIKSLDQTEIPTYTLNEVRAQPRQFTGALLEGGNGVIVAVPRGDMLPFDITAHLPFVTLVTERSWLRFEQDVWFYFAENDLMISPDGKRFGPLNSMRVLKELFQFEAGNLSLGFGVTSPGGARAALAVIAKPK